jgi:hypothetical protein
LKAYLFRAEGDEINVEEGPRLLALESFANNKLPLCSAKNAAQMLLGREISASEDSWLTELSATFANANYSYKALVKAIVMSPAYRRVR